MGEKCLVFVGTLNREAPYFQGARGNGLTVFDFDEETLAVRLLATHDTIDNPTFLSVDATGQRIYANSEIFGWSEGLVTALAFDPQTHAISHINMQPALGSITAHNAISRDGARVFVANYGMDAGGPDQSLVVYGIRGDGGLTSPLSSLQHSGTGPDAGRQERSHAHSVTEIADNLVLVADLGCDTLTTYAVGADGSLDRRAVSRTEAGAGPRHVACHPNGRLIFVMNELNSTVASFALDAAAGELVQLDAKPAVPEDIRASNHCADIQISPDGRFLYGSNRGHDSVVVFETNAETGLLTHVDYVPCGGATPRNLALSPSGRHLFCANQNSDCITIFARDAERGTLTDTGKVIEIGTPMCIRFAAASR